MLVPGLGPHRVVGEFVESILVSARFHAAVRRAADGRPRDSARQARGCFPVREVNSDSEGAQRPKAITAFSAAVCDVWLRSRRRDT